MAGTISPRPGAETPEYAGEHFLMSDQELRPHPLRWKRDAVLLAALALFSFLFYVRVAGYSFLYFDDNRMVYENEPVMAGLIQGQTTN